ncbi:MAG: Single-stranded DNA-binding protein ssb [Synergistetes bacterium ADurb.Bin155]|jgi:single-strand DNA-binding protein|nr:single-stranded DNA-binding protein [Synergistales bacterium]NMD18565.1 single-stranded DNA-binding protein [Synergistaceae bacterium]OQB46277.1 MAG: Single-stranded DNA-binding protein ssb [Synergistetes bacterium ADurb.Bin155]MBP8995946.1 single-stranded DNA-binding protein [Synergistales bacterium]HOC81601.1 single-stranded DNA-binding protein [Synergistales bacterium]
MARGFNKAILMGNLARDPEVRYTTSKQAVAKLTVAVGRQWKNREGEVQDQADFIPVVVWGVQAENCERYLRKGSPVLVEGRIQVRSYEAGTGERRWVTEVVAQGVTFLGSRRDGGETYSPEGEQAPPSRGGSLREKGFEDDYVRDISELDDVKDEGEDADIPF